MPRKAIYSADLGIDLANNKESERFKLFLACLLFGKPIQQGVACRTYEEFSREGLTDPDAILQAGWDRLVEVLDRGHYVRYDFSTATKLLEVCQALKGRYGTLTKLLAPARTKAELGRRLQEFDGIGPTTARIFVREYLAGQKGPMNLREIQKLGRRAAKKNNQPNRCPTGLAR